MAHKKKQPFNVNSGDVVRVVFDHIHGPGREKTVKVTEVTKRFGDYGDLLGYLDDPHGDEQFCDAKFVTQVFYRAPQSALPNRFRENRRRFADQNDPYREILENTGAMLFKRGILVGTLEGLVLYCLAKLPLALENPLHEERMKMLFKKQRPGLVRIQWRCVYTVNERPFMAWVRANATKLCATRQEADAAQRHEDAEREAEYWADVDAEMNRELKESLADLPRPHDEGSCYMDDDEPTWVNEELTDAELSAQLLEEESLAAGDEDRVPLTTDEMEAVRLHESEIGT